MRLGKTGKPLQSMRWTRSMVGTEYGKVKYWGGHPNSVRDVAQSSPCVYLDLPQHQLEPLIVTYAGHHGWPVRFNTQLVEATREESGAVLCTVLDLVSKITYQIRTKYLFGADGGRSSVARSFQFTFDHKPSQGVAMNILFKADLTHVIRQREAQLHWIMRPDTRSKFGIAPCLRMVKPWTEWLLMVVSPGGTESISKDLTPDSPDLIAYLKELIGDETIPVEIERVDGWVVREDVADSFSSGRDVFILGDAAHRHPPAHGLGSNTCIQDAYNLGWKAAYVAKGLAGPGLLDSFTLERQPVGATLVKEANECFREHGRVWAALGMMSATPEDGARQIAELSEPTEAGALRREELFQALEGKRREGESMGLAMNQFYVSNAVYLSDEPEARPEIKGDPITTMQISTYPGSRLPHAWLDVHTREKEVSTHDLAGHGAFSLFYGRGGEKWASAAANVSRATGIPINAYGIGFGLHYHDVYRDWQAARGVKEDGCILVRPDRYVAWRAQSVAADCETKLLEVLGKVLSRDTL